MITSIEILNPVAFKMKDKEQLSIIEACCYLRLSLDKFREFRNGLNVHPVSKAKPYLFRQEDVDTILIYLVANEMLELNPGIRCNTLMLPKEFYDYHLRKASAHFCHIGRAHLAGLFAQAVKLYKLFQ